jgi:hypothetical protein
MPEEIRFFLRIAGFGIALAVIYWIVSYEAAGSILLLAFGVAGAFLAVVLAVLVRGRGWPIVGPLWRWVGLGRVESPPIAEEPRRVPSPTVTPLVAGFGVAVASLSIAFGAAFVVAAAPALLVAASRWVREASREWRAVEHDDESLLRRR